MTDVTTGKTTEYTIHEHGFIKLVDCMPRLTGDGTCDSAILEAARLSYDGKNNKVRTGDRALLRYLLRHDHMTPFEMVELKFYCSMPKFVAAQWVRHRTASINEYSARYSVVEDNFYIPTLHVQSESNKQGSGDVLQDQSMQAEIKAHAEASYALYNKLLGAGVAREQARAVLPQNVYTRWYWKCDLRNVFGFLRLRMDKHAQAEIRAYADAMFDIVKQLAPLAAEAFTDYHLNSIRMTAVDIAALKGVPIANKREKAEYDEKRLKLGL